MREYVRTRVCVCALECAGRCLRASTCVYTLADRPCSQWFSYTLTHNNQSKQCNSYHAVCITYHTITPMQLVHAVSINSYNPANIGNCYRIICHLCVFSLIYLTHTGTIRQRSTWIINALRSVVIYIERSRKDSVSVLRPRTRRMR